MKSMKNMKTTSKIYLCCLNSKNIKFIEITLLFINFVCFAFYILFFSTISWVYIDFLYQFLFYLGFVFFLMNFAINIYFIYLLRKRRINTFKNDIIKTLSISIIIICVISMILNYFCSYNILYSIINIDKDQNVGSFKTNNKKRYVTSIIFIIIINVIWFVILFLWIAEFIKIKINYDEASYNYLKKEVFKKNLELYNEEYLKESNNQLDYTRNKNIKVKIENKRNTDNFNGINIQLIKDIKGNNKSNDSINNIDFESHSKELIFSKKI